MYQQYIKLKEEHPGLGSWPKANLVDSNSRSSIIINWWRGGVNNAQQEMWAELFNKCKDAPDLSHEEIERLTAFPIKKYRYPRIAQTLANTVKLTVTITRTEACRLVAYRELVKEADLRHIRKTDQSKILPYALELCFMATEDEKMAKVLASSRQAVDDSHFMTTARKTGNHWFTRWLGFAPRAATNFTP